MRPPPTHGPFGRDFEAYYAAGATWNAGRDPWSRDIWSAERAIEGVDRGEELLPFIGPAFVLPLFGALARLPFGLAERVWSGLLALAFGALVLGALALARERRVTALLAAMLLGVTSGPAVSDLALAQAALLSAAGIACALVAFRGGTVFAGAAATLVAGVQPNLAVALLARLRDRVALVATAGALAVYAAIVWAAGGGAAGIVAYAHRLAEHGAAERFDAIQYAPAAIARGFGCSPDVANALGVAIAALAIVATITAIVRARLDATDGTLLAIAALPLAVPFFHEHDFVVVLIPLLVLAVRARGRVRPIAGVATALVAVDWFGLAQRPLAAAQIVALGLAAAAAFAALGRGARAARADAAPALVVLVLACVAVPLARAHPAPTWPDALPSAYRAPAGTSAAGVWPTSSAPRGSSAATRRGRCCARFPSPAASRSASRSCEERGGAPSAKQPRNDRPRRAARSAPLQPPPPDPRSRPRGAREARTRARARRRCRRPRHAGAAVPRGGRRRAHRHRR
ncbi:MAG TPA: glycosyltransferase 87 family protein [Candidatus Elarobacter sp.]|nr:glycosyltransferase 87 family protein [Candidatus Elarobacter sp.]